MIVTVSGGVERAGVNDREHLCRPTRARAAPPCRARCFFDRCGLQRRTAARREWPAFEERLRELGYGQLAIAHAFSTLSGAGTVAEALEVLKGLSRPVSHPVALAFEMTEGPGGGSAANGVAITSVERDDLGIRVTYDAVPPVGLGSLGPRGEAKDDLGNHYDGLGGHFGRVRSRWRGGLMVPLPPPAATMLRIRIAWDASRSSVWERPAHEVRISLLD